MSSSNFAEWCRITSSARLKEGKCILVEYIDLKSKHTSLIIFTSAFMVNGVHSAMLFIYHTRACSQKLYKSDVTRNAMLELELDDWLDPSLPSNVVVERRVRALRRSVNLSDALRASEQSPYTDTSDPDPPPPGPESSSFA
jgi:hypothetical protein